MRVTQILYLLIWGVELLLFLEESHCSLWDIRCIKNHLASSAGLKNQILALIFLDLFFFNIFLYKCCCLCYVEIRIHICSSNPFWIYNLLIIYPLVIHEIIVYISYWCVNQIFLTYMLTLLGIKNYYFYVIFDAGFLLALS